MLFITKCAGEMHPRTIIQPYLRHCHFHIRFRYHLIKIGFYMKYCRCKGTACDKKTSISDEQTFDYIARCSSRMARPICAKKKPFTDQSGDGIDAAKQHRRYLSVPQTCVLQSQSHTASHFSFFLQSKCFPTLMENTITFYF